jgi:NAD(P)-dependent dehydrogenase (short-subunit alcohol dehydrogenase family)
MKTTWFITGADRGLGRHLARAAAQAGHHVVAAGPDRARLNGVLGPDGERLHTLEFDLMDPSAAKAAIVAAMRRFGSIDILVHNASEARMASANELEERALKAHFLADFFSAHVITEAALPFLRAAGRALVLHVSPPGAADPMHTLVESNAVVDGFVPAAKTFSSHSQAELAQELLRLAADVPRTLPFEAGAPANGRPNGSFLH